MNSSDTQLDLIDGVIYGDLFECAVTLEEIQRYSRVAISLAELEQCLSQPKWQPALIERDGFYCLRGREFLFESTHRQRERAARLRRRALRVARWLQYAPFVRGILLTGSVAAEAAAENADVDFMFLVAHGRLSLAFLLLGTVSRLLSRQLFCPNYYLSDGNLEATRRDHYIAHEFAQAQALAGKGIALLMVNKWVTKFLPNSTPRVVTVARLPGGRSLQRLFELPLQGRFGNWLEHRAQRIAWARLAVHYGLENRGVPQDIRDHFERGIELRFHGSSSMDNILERYHARRADIGRAIANGSLE